MSVLKSRLSEDTCWFLNSLNDGIMIADANSIVIFVNEAYSKLTGVEFDRIVGKHVWEERPGGGLPNVIETKVKMINTYHIIKGVRSYVDLIPLFDNDNKIIGGIAVIKDYNEIENLSELLQKNKRNLDFITNTLLDMHKANNTFSSTIGYGLEEVIENAKKAACSDLTVFLTGESGTGKGMIAEAIHNASDRKDKAFVAINMTAIPSELLESELFGYEEGSFTGAKKQGKMGLISVAEGGTVFLDEIGDMPLSVQTKLLKVIEEKRIRKVGSNKENKVDVRFISATNQDLIEKVRRKEFREDLYYRLAVFTISIPSLKERREYLPLYIKDYLKYWGKKLKHNIDLEGDAYHILINYDYPGNVRELKNSIEYAVNVMSNYKIKVEDLPNYMKKDISKLDFSERTLDGIIVEVEKDIIGRYIRRYGNTLEAKKQIAKKLDISLATLYNKIQKYNLK